MTLTKPSDESAVMAVGFVTLSWMAVSFAATIMGFVKLYRTWEIIQPLKLVDPSEAEMPTPGQAVGLMFVPLYSLYWMFIAFHGLATRTNKYIQVTNAKVAPMNENRARLICILTLCGVVPCVNFVALPVNVVLIMLFFLELDRIRGQMLLKEDNDILIFG